VGQGIYYAVVAALATAATVQIAQQVFFAPSAGAPPFASCDDGLRRFYQAIQEGRSAAERSDPDAREDTALARYRAAVEPTWRHRSALWSLCQNEPDRRSILDAMERLRYSEEHGVRHQAAELTTLRRRVHKMTERLAAERAP
jgi:hypothetical protein